MRTVPVALLLCLSFFSPAYSQTEYLVFVEGAAFKPAAEKLAAHHGGMVVEFDSSNLEPVLNSAREHQPQFAAFVLPPEKIDVDLAHEILELSVRVDEDIFVDYEYGFITGRDGDAASAFVDRIIAAHSELPNNDDQRTAGFFGSWEGQMLPPSMGSPAFEAMGFEAESRYVLVSDEAEKKQADARSALAGFAEKDALLFFSHGYPDQMVACFDAQNLRDWDVNLNVPLLVNCSCYNGATGRWFAPGPGGPTDKGLVDPQESVALQIIDSGVVCYFAGIDPWHGPLAIQVFDMVAGEGMRAGEAAKKMYDRLALDFAPELIDFPKTMEHPLRFSGEGTNNRRHNGGGMILYGDPAFRPFPDATPKAFIEFSNEENNLIQLGTRPLMAGPAGDDFIIPMNILLDYYSVKSSNIMEEIGMEFYRTVKVSDEWTEAPELTVSRIQLGHEEDQGAEITAKEPQAVLEHRVDGTYLHIRVPLGQRWMPPGLWPMRIAQEGALVELKVGG
ncbi:MAG: hypothetical protein AAF456_05620 [Planctomycetota bacterium]